MRQSAALAGAGLLVPFRMRRRRATDLSIGFQTWVVREPLAKDFPGTLAEMAAMGYETMEMC